MTTRSRLGDDAGMTLVELILYLAIGVVVLLGVGRVFVTGWQSDAATRDRDRATNQAQLAATAIQSGIRSSSGFDVTGNLMRAVVATGASTWTCRAWLLTGDGRLLQHSQDTAIAVPATTTGWTELTDGVTGTLAGGAPFVRDASATSMLRFGFTVAHGDATVPITGGAVAQAVGEGTPTCW